MPKQQNIKLKNYAAFSFNIFLDIVGFTHVAENLYVWEVLMNNEPAKIPKNFEIRYFTFSKSIFYKIRFAINDWIYKTKHEVLYIICEEIKELISHH